jgi:hypothetical protein
LKTTELPLSVPQVNANDQDGGILSGNWSGDYSGGTNPSDWNGTVAIMEEYVKNKRDVRWAQCWVFSCTTTTGNHFPFFLFPVELVVVGVVSLVVVVVVVAFWLNLWFLCVHMWTLEVTCVVVFLIDIVVLRFSSVAIGRI